MKEAKASLLDGEHISGERISTLPYMDAVLVRCIRVIFFYQNCLLTNQQREVLRLSPPVPGTSRKALKDDMLPLAQPVTLRNGETVDSVRIKQGDDIFISISAFNQSRSLWGEDALEFNPERWLKMDGDSSLTSDSQLSFLAASPLLTFLGGPRGCIGFRFSLRELLLLNLEHR